MSDTAAAAPGPIITQISFNENGVEFVYSEPRDADNHQRTGIASTRVKYVPVRHILPEVQELLEAAGIALERALEVERDAPDSFSR